MKICVLVQNLYTLGGIQRVVTTILNELVNDENYDITVVMPFKMSGEKLFKIDERIKLKNQEELSVNREHKPVRYIFALNKRIGFLDNSVALPFVLNNRIAPQEKENYIKYFNEENFDVVIGAGIEYSLLLGEIKKDISAKTIGWQHSTYGSYFERRGATGYGLTKYVKKCYSALDGIWVLTNSDKKEFDNNLAIESKVLYNPLPKNDSISTTYEEGYVLFAGRLEREHKGLDYLIEVIKKISEEVPKLRVTIIGDGPSHNWLKVEIEKAGLGEKVNLLGTTDNVYQFYSRASVMVQTSRWEGFGMTILEAMSCGIPVVAFHNYGPDEIIRDSVDGYLVDHFDTEVFAKKVAEILKQPEQREQMGKCAIERSRDFSLEKVLPLFKQYLEEAAKGL